jgi:hypothetical protein
VTETAEAKGDTNFITDVGLTDAQTDDKAALGDIQSRLEQRGLAPEDQIVDQNYVSGQKIAESEEKHIALIGPIAAQPGPEGFKRNDFRIDFESRQAICPMGRVSEPMTVASLSNGTFRYQFRFGKQCDGCLVRPQCTQAVKGRTIQIEEHDDYIRRRRLEMESEAFQQLMKRRPPIEGTLSQLTRQGMRRARYRGLSRVNMQLIFTALAVNLRRLCHALANGNSPSWANG